MQQLCSSQVVFGALQNTSKNSLWYKVPKDAPGSVDLATHMFALTRAYDGQMTNSATVPKKVVRKVYIDMICNEKFPFHMKLINLSVK